MVAHGGRFHEVRSALWLGNMGASQRQAKQGSWQNEAIPSGNVIYKPKYIIIFVLKMSKMPPTFTLSKAVYLH